METSSPLTKEMSKKVAIQIYFIIFIILNILDFAALLDGDIDFFKKLLSWGIIGYVFYKASFTKIFIGTRLIIYDLFYLVGFSFIALIKSLILYVNLPSTQQATFVFFGFFIDFIRTLNINELVLKGFILGLVIVTINSIVLLLNHKVQKKSLIGSLNLSEYLRFIKFDFVLLILTALFFGIIVFNFFMEWFALAVDSLILVLGLGYYLFKFIHNHTQSRASSFLQNISNTGNSFYQGILDQFSDKKSFFVGVSFILTLLLLVDVGVYIIPYFFGNENALYAPNLDRPLLSLTNPNDSRLLEDLESANVLLAVEIIFVYLTTIFMLAALMIYPFYYFYQNVQRKRVKLNSVIVLILFLSSIIFAGIAASGDFDYPLKITESSTESEIFGVKIETHTLLNNNENLTAKTLLLTILIAAAFGATFYVYKTPEFMRVIGTRVLPVIILLFFMAYILIFYYTTVKADIEDVSAKITLDNNANLYNSILHQYENNMNYKEKRPFSVENVPTPGASIKMTPFSDKSSEQIISGEEHNDYLLIEIKNLDTKKKYTLDEERIIFKNRKDYSSKTFKNEDVTMIYVLGKEKFQFTLENGDTLKLTNVYNPSQLFLVEDKKNFSFEKFRKFLTLIFSSIFYIIGTIEFARFFVKKNIIN